MRTGPNHNARRSAAADDQTEYLPKLDTPEWQAAIEPSVDQADAIFVDNRGCLLDPEGEKAPSQNKKVQQALAAIIAHESAGGKCP